jgi:hypothetical protein
MQHLVGAYGLLGRVYVCIGIAHQSSGAIAFLGQTDAHSKHILQNIALIATFLSAVFLMTFDSGHALRHIPHPVQFSVLTTIAISVNPASTI